jgi:hypothetical protein
MLPSGASVAYDGYKAARHTKAEPATGSAGCFKPKAAEIDNRRPIKHAKESPNPATPKPPL